MTTWKTVRRKTRLLEARQITDEADAINFGVQVGDWVLRSNEAQWPVPAVFYEEFYEEAEA